MKKTILLSLAAATAFTFGATNNDAKAANMQPVKVQTFTYNTPFQFFYQPLSQNSLQTLFTSFLQQNGMTSPFNYIVFGQPVITTQKTVPTSIPKPVPTQPETKPAPTQPETKPAPTQPETKPVPTQPETKPVPTQPETKPVPTPKPEQTPAPTNGLSAFEQRVIALTNVERQKAGLSALQTDLALSKVAKAKSQDMANYNYFDHNSPTYGSPFDMMKRFGITYSSAGENIAKGQRTPEEVVQAWMNSAGHRANILNATYTHIGLGYVENGNIWTQHFISK